MTMQRNADGSLPAFACPGGYPLYYLDKDNCRLCPECANDPECEPPAIAQGAHYEGATIVCEACGAEIKSAYGDPDEVNPNEADEPDEDSLTSSNGRDWFQYGKCVLTIDEDEDRKEAIRDWMEREQFWPDAFVISDHGNAIRVDLT